MMGEQPREESQKMHAWARLALLYKATADG
jgi:hypothetical protein